VKDNNFYNSDDFEDFHDFENYYGFNNDEGVEKEIDMIEDDELVINNIDDDDYEDFDEPRELNFG